MRVVKKKILRLFFSVEVLVFTAVYLFGAHGIQTLMGLKKENNALLVDIESLKQEVVALESDIAIWQSDDFYTEKIAREQLQMAKKGDTIYYYNT